jgi:hypothetical protein
MAVMMRFMSDKGPVDTVEFDGYQIAERLLEGVKFQATIENDTVVVRVHPNDAVYFSKFDSSKWLNEAKIYVMEGDGDFDLADGRTAWLEQ